MANYGGKKQISKDTLARGVLAVAPDRVIKEQKLSLTKLRKKSRRTLAAMYKKYI